MNKTIIKCRSCGADIFFIMSTKGRRIPCDAAPVRFDYELGAEGRVVTANGEVLPAVIREDGKEEGYISHFSTCPNAAHHRKR